MLKNPFFSGCEFWIYILWSEKFSIYKLWLRDLMPSSDRTSFSRSKAFNRIIPACFSQRFTISLQRTSYSSVSYECESTLEFRSWSAKVEQVHTLRATVIAVVLISILRSWVRWASRESTIFRFEIFMGTLHGHQTTRSTLTIFEEASLLIQFDNWTLKIYDISRWKWRLGSW